MKLKLLSSFVFVLAIHNFIEAKDSTSNNYFIEGKDTTFCKSLAYTTTGQGYLKSISYEDMDGKKVELKSKKELPEVETFCIEGTFFDKTPLKADKPDGYIRYTERVVDGKLKLYLGEQGSFTSTNVATGKSTTGAVGSYRFFIKMPDGKYYQVNKDMKKVIRPYLEKCAEFKKQYKGDYGTGEQEFKETVTLYNSLCD